MAQSFFISRIIRFAERPLIKYGTPILLAPLVLWQFIGLQLYFSAGLTLDTSQINQLRKYAISTFIAQSTVDIMVAIVMSFLLYSRRSVIKRTNHIIKNLIIASVVTGAWPAVINVVTIFNFTKYKGKVLYAGPFYLLPFFYINSVLGNLNLRSFIRSQGNGVNIVGSNSSPNSG